MQALRLLRSVRRTGVGPGRPAAGLSSCSLSDSPRASIKLPTDDGGCKSAGHWSVRHRLHNGGAPVKRLRGELQIPRESRIRRTCGRRHPRRPFRAGLTMPRRDRRDRPNRWIRCTTPPGGRAAADQRRRCAADRRQTGTFAAQHPQAAAAADQTSSLCSRSPTDRCIRCTTPQATAPHQTNAVVVQPIADRPVHSLHNTPGDLAASYQRRSCAADRRQTSGFAAQPPASRAAAGGGLGAANVLSGVSCAAYPSASTDRRPTGRSARVVQPANSTPAMAFFPRRITNS